MAIGFFDGNKADASPESIKRKREMIARMMASARSPRNIGEGFNAIGNNIAAAMLGRQSDEEERANEAERSRIMAGLFGGGGAPMASAGNPVATGSATGSGATRAPQSFTGTQTEFVAKIMPYAVQEGERTGVDPRIIVAQAALESGYGRSAPGNNFFGIKSHGKPGGQTFATTEVINGQTKRINDSFRTFASMGDSVRGYGDFLKQNPRYRPMLEAQGMDAQIAALGRSGYATDPNYASKIRSIASGIRMPAINPGNGATPMPLQTASAGPQSNDAQMQDGAGELQAGGSGLMAEPAVYRGQLNDVPSADLMQRGPMPALPPGFDLSSLVMPAGQPADAMGQGIADNEEQTRMMEAQMAAEQGLPYAGNEPGPVSEPSLYSPIPMGLGDNPFLPREPDAMAQAPAPAPAPMPPAPSMDRRNFDQITSTGAPLNPAFMAEGISPSWGIGDPNAPPPVAQEAAVTGPGEGFPPMPPRRPANLGPQSPFVPPAMRQPMSMDFGGENSGGAMQFIESEFARREGRPDPRTAMGAPGQIYNPFVQQPPQAPQMPAGGGSVQGVQGGAMASGPAQAPAQAQATRPGMIPERDLVAVLTSGLTTEAQKKFAMDTLTQQRAMQQAEAERARVQAQNNDTADALKIDRRLGGVTPAVAAAAKAKFDRMAGNAKRSLQPVFGVDAKGNTVMLQLGDDGTVVQPQLPKDVQLATGVDKVDTGTEFVFMDKRTGAVVGRQPKDVAGAARQGVIGKDEGERIVNAPGEIRVADNALKTLEQIRSHPGREGWGAQGPTAALPWINRAVPGTPGRDFVALVEQAQGQAFLQAFESLKGGGQITETEGRAATAALARLDRTQSRQGFDTALNDIKSLLETARDRARRNVRVTPDGTEVPAGPSAPSAPGASKVLRYNPKTGALE